MKMEQTECSETSAYKIQTPGNYTEESIKHSEHGESLKSTDEVDMKRNIHPEKNSETSDACAARIFESKFDIFGIYFKYVIHQHISSMEQRPSAAFNNQSAIQYFSKTFKNSNCQ